MPRKFKAETGSLADDVLWGADQIAEFIGRTPTQVYYLASRHLIPVRKVGRKTLTATKSGLREHFGTQQGGSDAR